MGHWKTLRRELSGISGRVGGHGTLEGPGLEMSGISWRGSRDSREALGLELPGIGRKGGHGTLERSGA